MRAQSRNAHAAGEIAVGNHPQSGYRAAETVLAGAIEVEARFERQSVERSADCFAFDPQSSRRQPDGTRRSGPIRLNRPDHRTVRVNAPKTARAIDAIVG